MSCIKKSATYFSNAHLLPLRRGPWVVELKDDTATCRYLWCIVTAKLGGQILSVQIALQTLRHKGGFFIADDLYDAVLVETGAK